MSFSKKIRIFASYIRPHKKLFAIDMLLSLAVAAIDLIFPILSRFALQKLLPDKLFTTFFTVMGIMIAAYFLKAFMYYQVTVVGHTMGTRVEADMRRDVFSHMQKLSFSYYDKNRTGELMGRVTNDLFEIVELAHHGPENLLICSATLLGSIIILMTVNPTLSLVLLIMMPITVFFTGRERKAMERANRQVKQETGRINAAIESSISGIRTAKAFANENAEEDKFAIANERFKLSKVSYYKAMGRYMGGLEASVSLMQVVVITIGGYLIMQGRMDYIDIITFALYVSTFTSPIRKVGMFMEIYSQGMAGFGRFVELMETEPEIKDDPDAIDLCQVTGNIKYKDVSFSYQDNTEVLKNINLDIDAGKTYALVGPSGEGKTTLCHLLMRFYDVKSGSIEVDGKDIKKVTQDSLRRNIGIIQQDVFIFAGTVMDNIRYGRPDATDMEVVRAAKLARIHEEIEKMPKGYETYVGERGVALSGGQKQRISIARVFLKNPPILILDEATSALDSVTEAQIQKSLNELSKDRTCIIIAHRLSTIKGADCIAVIEGQSIAELGSREELLKNNGIYATLEAAQLQGE